MISDLFKSIAKRRSVRTFDGRALSAEDLSSIQNFTKSIKNPFNIPVEFKFLSAKESGLNCPVVLGTDLYVGGKIKKGANASVAFGFSFEMLLLYAQSLGVGSVWLGGTMNRLAFERAMNLSEDEIMPCASPLGYEAEKLSLRESVMRKAIKADERLPFEELFFTNSFKNPLTKEKAGDILGALEGVRLAPSAVNKQPWRAVIVNDTVHFYLKRSKGFSYNESHDMQAVDMGIALCHFYLGLIANGKTAFFEVNNPKIEGDNELEYVASYAYK